MTNDVLGKTHLFRLECSIKIEEIEDQNRLLIQFDLLEAFLLLLDLSDL